VVCTLILLAVNLIRWITMIQPSCTRGDECDDCTEIMGWRRAKSASIK
jgi:hypothetical protein